MEDISQYKVVISVQDDQYFYKLLQVSDSIGVIESLLDGSQVEIYYDGIEWQLGDYFQPHNIEFYKSLDEKACRTIYGSYKQLCDVWWTYRILSNQDPKYYKHIIDEMNKCLQNRLAHNYGCFDSIDEGHLGAIRKIEFKIILCYMWLSEDIKIMITSDSTTERILHIWDTYNPDKNIINKLLRLPIEMLINHITNSGVDNVVITWKEIVGSINTKISKLKLIALLLQLESIKGYESDIENLL